MNNMIRKIIFNFLFCFFLFPAFSQTEQWSMVIGGRDGLYGLDQLGRTNRLWSGGEVLKIIPPNRGSPWFIMSDAGIFASVDLRNWESRNQGLPLKTIKVFQNGNTSLLNIVQQIKDFEIDPQNSENMVLAIKDAVFLSRNGGRTWENIGMPNYRTNGIKAVAVTTLDGILTVFSSHNIYGIYYITPGRAGAVWTELSTGLEVLESTNNPDEIADIAIWIPEQGRPEIFASQTFRRRLYHLDWDAKRFNLIWSGPQGFGTIDSLTPVGNNAAAVLRFIQDGNIMEFPFSRLNASSSLALGQRQDIINRINAIPQNISPNSIAIPEGGGFTSLNELWLLSEPGNRSRFPADTIGINLEGIYLPVNHAMDRFSLAPYMDLIRNRELNMVVIDMKDDYGRLRFSPQNPALDGWGRVFRPIDLEDFLKTMKDAGIYTVARIVVFKDPEIANKDGRRYSVWDRQNNIPWEGYQDNERTRTYDERWVDPYAEDVWEYIALLSEELCLRGFDEIQFDYIRFPTDGVNLADAHYRWRNPGMDMDSAILSFLRHVRPRIQAPISVDIYGANGWYRTGARTGQEVELFTPWIDIICPMYYPSHFEQHFLAQNPAEMRPYRIYYHGTLRNHTIARGRAIIRPWAQSFYLNVSYDRQYYGLDYVRHQLDGVRDAGNGGLTYWNNLGRYDEVPIP